MNYFAPFLFALVLMSASFAAALLEMSQSRRKACLRSESKVHVFFFFHEEEKISDILAHTLHPGLVLFLVHEVFFGRKKYVRAFILLLKV